MKIWIASARIATIESLVWLPLEGIITNPSVLLQAGADWRATVRNLARHDFGEGHPLEQVHVQATGATAKDIYAEMAEFRELISPRRLICKIPAVPEGYKVLPRLIDDGMTVNVTAVCSISQAQVALQGGARFVALYVARLNESDRDGTAGYRLVEDIRTYIERNGLDAEIIAASIRDQEQYEHVLRRGVHAVAAPPELLHQVLEHPLTERSVASFRSEWQENAV